ncbi:MAG TPA: hypothetical protein VGH87_16450 [Polyangiaceae bacterium]|jgi:hypothetical protein|nr:hypothetical protein [Polyangiaceae bacterium]
MMRFVPLVFVMGCGTTTPPSFACGDSGATCQTSSQFCDIVTQSGSVTATCETFPKGCYYCGCLTDGGVGGSCIGTTTCTPKDDGTITVTTTCIP